MFSRHSRKKCFVKQEHYYLQKAKLIDAKRVQAATSRQIMVDCILAATSSTSTKQQKAANAESDYSISNTSDILQLDFRVVLNSHPTTVKSRPIGMLEKYGVWQVIQHGMLKVLTHLKGNNPTQSHQWLVHVNKEMHNYSCKISGYLILAYAYLAN